MIWVLIWVLNNGITSQIPQASQVACLDAREHALAQPATKGASCKQVPALRANMRPI